MKHELPKLPYAYDALEPYIDARTMEIHHSKHHQGYVDKLNAALEGQAELADQPLEDLLKNPDLVPEDMRTAIRNNGGGHYNHSLFWQVMTPASAEATAGRPSGEIAKAIDDTFGKFEQFKEEFSHVAVARFGSGWAWLSVAASGQLTISSTANQDSPIMDGLTPILGLDVWEHAYYLKYQNRRADYIEAWWQVVNWEQVAENFKSA